MSTVVTVKLTPLEFDLLREALSDWREALTEREANVLEEISSSLHDPPLPEDAAGLMTVRRKMIEAEALHRKLS